MGDQTFITPGSFPDLEDVKKDGDKHKFILEAECIGDPDSDGDLHWKILTLDGVKVENPETDRQSEEDENQEASDFDSYDESQDEGGAPKTADDVGKAIMAPPD